MRKTRHTATIFIDFEASAMCQAYEAERNTIVASEEREAIKGFAAARAGKSKDTNPHNKYLPIFQYEKKAWDHGWECFNEALLPWALEKLAGNDVNTRVNAQNFVRANKKLIPKLEKIFSSYI